MRAFVRRSATSCKAPGLFSRLKSKAVSSVNLIFAAFSAARPPHHSAARADLVLLIRRTVRPRGYASGHQSLGPCWVAFSCTLRGYPLLVQGVRAGEVRHVGKVFHSLLEQEGIDSIEANVCV